MKTPKTKPVTKFDIYMEQFLDAIKAFSDEKYATRFAILVPSRWEIHPGRRYFKIVEIKQERSHKDGSIKDGQSSVHCFVDNKNGDILKAATWRAPVTDSSRGNIYTSALPVDSYYVTSPGVVVVKRDMERGG